VDESLGGRNRGGKCLQQGSVISQNSTVAQDFSSMDFLEKKYTLQEYEQLLDQSITDRNGIFF
jgi:hypothetical protein